MGVEKGGGRKTSRMTPLPKSGFRPPSFGTFSTPLWRRCSCFLLKKCGRLTRPDALFEGVQKFSGGRCVVRYALPPPIRFAPPHVMAQFSEIVAPIVTASRKMIFRDFLRPQDGHGIKDNKASSVGDGMGGGRNGRFWGAPIFGQNPGKSREFQVTVCGVTVCPFSRHKGNQRPKCLENKAQMHLSRNCPFRNKTNLHLELPGFKSSMFSTKKDAKSGRPKSSRSYHHPSHPPLDALL